MRITFVTPPGDLSGGLRVIAIYAQQLSMLGHTVQIVSPGRRGAPLLQRLKSKLNFPELFGQKRQSGSHFEAYNIDYRELDTWRPITDSDVNDADVVIATWWETAEWVHSLSHSKGRKVYFIQHHEVFPHLPVDRCRATYRLPLHKIVVAPWLMKTMRVEYGDENVDIVLNAVDHSQFYANVRGKQTIPTVGFLYSWANFKGVDVSLAALEKVRSHIPELKILAFGSEQPHAGLELLTGTEFSFCPAQDQIRQIYASCDVWITASRSEGFNLTAMEAMACRTPVISTPTGWPADAIKANENGLLVEFDDPENLQDAIRTLLSTNEHDWKQLSANAYATVEDLTWENSAKLFENALRRAPTL